MSDPRSMLRNVAAERGGYFRSRDAEQAGVNRVQIQRCAEEGFVERVARGLYRIAGFPPHPYPDLAVVALRAPDSVVCLISALAFHEITTQIPHQVDLAIAKGGHVPKMDYPPIEVRHISEPAFSMGVEAQDLEGITIQIYSAEKTLADCFKFRNQIGMDVAIEALRLYRDRKRLDANALVKYAKACRVMRVMDPYLESLI